MGYGARGWHKREHYCCWHRCAAFFISSFLFHLEPNFCHRGPIYDVEHICHGLPVRLHRLFLICKCYISVSSHRYHSLLWAVIFPIPLVWWYLLRKFSFIEDTAAVLILFPCCFCCREYYTVVVLLLPWCYCCGGPLPCCYCCRDDTVINCSCPDFVALQPLA